MKRILQLQATLGNLIMEGLAASSSYIEAASSEFGWLPSSYSIIQRTSAFPSKAKQGKTGD